MRKRGSYVSISTTAIPMVLSAEPEWESGGENSKQCSPRFFPAARHVEGRSWLYGAEAYRRLFPEDYVRSRAVIESGSRFQGMAWWGQFLDREGNVKRPLKEALLGNLDRLNTNRLWEAFPLPVFRVSAQIDSFYARYAIEG